MSARPVLVTGAAGLMGAHLLEAFGKLGPVAGTALTQSGGALERLDLRTPDASRRLVGRLEPAAVVCAAAIPSVERCELEPGETWDVNVAGTLELADAAREAGATFVFLSSEYVFDGVHGPYAEDDAVRPINEYGRQKVAVESALAERQEGDFIVARVSCVYGHEARRKNFVYQLWSALGEGHTLKVPSDQIGTPTEASNAAQVIAELWSAGERGIFNVVGADRVLRSDFGAIVAEELGLDPGLLDPVPTEQLGLAAPRPKGAGLLNDRAAAAADTPLLGIREGLRGMLAQGPIDVSEEARR
jgi:dTDP-4-dehydrorhamnose reductase